MNVDANSENERPYWHLTLYCPKCGAAGEIPWDRLDRVFVCSGCTTWYRLEGSSHLTEIEAPPKSQRVSVRTSFSEWTDHRLAKRFRPRRSLWRRLNWEWITAPIVGLLVASWRIRAGIIMGSIALIVSVCWLANRSPGDAAAHRPLPATLEERAPLFMIAWANRDTTTMLRLTAPENGRELQHWSAKTLRPSALVQCAPDQMTIESVKVDMQHDPHVAIATVHVSCDVPSDSGTAKHVDFVQRQIWNSRDGEWFFSPRDMAAQQSAAPAGGRRPMPVPSRRRTGPMR